MKTLPSEGDLATEADAISPLAPARFSTTTLRPSRSLMPGAIRRVSRSFGPPGGKPTTKRKVLSGKSAVWAWAAANGRPESAARTERRRSIVIGGYVRLPATGRKRNETPHIHGDGRRCAQRTGRRAG